MVGIYAIRHSSYSIRWRGIQICLLDIVLAVTDEAETASNQVTGKQKPVDFED